jgi:hypothetical protein
VLLTENMSADFIQAFIEFIVDGRYQEQFGDIEHHNFFRFT